MYASGYFYTRRVHAKCKFKRAKLMCQTLFIGGESIVLVGRECVSTCIR